MRTSICVQSATIDVLGPAGPVATLLVLIHADVGGADEPGDAGTTEPVFPTPDCLVVGGLVEFAGLDHAVGRDHRDAHDLSVTVGLRLKKPSSNVGNEPLLSSGTFRTRR
jgi:hypothetical protein